LEPILTLNSRSHLMLEIVRDHLKLTTAGVRAEIGRMHDSTIRVLAAKGIKYDTLRSALVPSADKHEAGLVFDPAAVESSWYVFPIIGEVLPLLEPRASQSILCGDLIGRDQASVIEMIMESMVVTRPLSYPRERPLFCVYLNNLSDQALQRINQRLAVFPAYLGYIPATFSSRAKTYLSMTLVNTFLKHGKKVIMGDPDAAERPDEENVNTLCYPFKESGYEVRSLQSDLFGVFLSFKIERPVYLGFEADSEMAINAISEKVHPITDFDVELVKQKHAYLLREKLGKLQKAQIENLDSHQLASLIKSKLASNYIYNMVYLPEHEVMKFNIMLEVERDDGGYPTRLTAALEYLPKERLLRVITLC